MGNSHPSPPSASNSRFSMASRAFSKQELDDLLALLSSLASQSQTDGRVISRPVFLAYFGIRGPLGDRLFQLVPQGSGGDDGVTFEGLIWNLFWRQFMKPYFQKTSKLEKIQAKILSKPC